MVRGGSRIFFRRGCTRLLFYFNTNKPHSFFCRIPVVLENRRSSRGGGGAHLLHLPPDPLLMVLGPWSSFPKGNCRDPCWKIGVNPSSVGRGGEAFSPRGFESNF